MLANLSVRRAGLLALIVASAALSACRISPSGTLLGPSIGLDGWSVAESKHFVVRADLSEKETTEIAQDLERTYQLLFEIGFPMDKDPNLMSDAVVFRTRGEYLQYGPPNSDGFFRRGGFGRLEGGTFMTFGGVGLSARHVFIHEMTHRFVYHACPQAPTWLNEGLADYYETMTYGDGKVVIGRSEYVFKKGDLWTHGGVPIAALPKWDELVAMGPKEFYAAREAPETEEGIEARRKQAANYASAWATVNVLQNRTDHYGDRLYQYMSRMASGMAAPEAFRQTLGDLDSAKIDADREELVEHLALGDATVYKTDHDGWADTGVSSHKAAPAEELLIRAELDTRMNGDHDAAAREHVDQALAKQPGLTGGILLRARLLREAGSFAEAEADLEHANRTAPDDEQVAQARFYHYWAPLPGKKQDPAHVEKAEAILKDWLPRARSPVTLNSFAWYMTLHGRAAEAVPVAKRSIEADPSCADCYDTLALALFRSGSYKEAVTTQEMALAVLGERARDPGMFGRLQGYQSAWSQMVLWKKRPAPGRDPAALPEEVALAIVKAQSQEITSCYRQSLTRAPELAGSLVIQGEIGLDGKLTKVSLLPKSEWDSLPDKPLAPALTDDELTRCVLEQAGAVTFPKSSQPTTFRAPFHFEPKKKPSN